MNPQGNIHTFHMLTMIKKQRRGREEVGEEEEMSKYREMRADRKMRELLEVDQKTYFDDLGSIETGPKTTSFPSVGLASSSEPFRRAGLRVLCGWNTQLRDVVKRNSPETTGMLCLSTG